MSQLISSIGSAHVKDVLTEVDDMMGDLGDLHSSLRSFQVEVDHIEITEELAVHRGEHSLLVLLVIDDIEDGFRVPFHIQFFLSIFLLHQKLDRHLVFFRFLTLHHLDGVLLALHLHQISIRGVTV